MTEASTEDSYDEMKGRGKDERFGKRQLRINLPSLLLYSTEVRIRIAYGGGLHTLFIDSSDRRSPDFIYSNVKFR